MLHAHFHSSLSRVDHRSSAGLHAGAYRPADTFGGAAAGVFQLAAVVGQDVCCASVHDPAGFPAGNDDVAGSCGLGWWGIGSVIRIWPHHDRVLRAGHGDGQQSTPHCDDVCGIRPVRVRAGLARRGPVAERYRLDRRGHGRGRPHPVRGHLQRPERPGTAVRRGVADGLFSQRTGWLFAPDLLVGGRGIVALRCLPHQFARRLPCGAGDRWRLCLVQARHRDRRNTWQRRPGRHAASVVAHAGAGC